jgi:periplasmic divalent cation tolerance protein
MQYEPIVVQFTVPSVEVAEAIGSTLLQEKLIACLHISGQVKSIYHWEGAIESSTEYVVQAKTFSIFWSAIEARILELHTYSVPEIIAFPIREISHYYYVWMIQEIIEKGNK